MKKFAHIKNSDNTILKIQEYQDTYNPLSVDHKFGPTYAIRIVPYNIDDNLVFNTATHAQVKTQNVAANEVRIQKSLRPLTLEELSINADNANRDNKMVEVGKKVTILRQWATDARNTTVTPENQVAVMNQVVNRLGKFFDFFGDLIEARRYDK